MTLLGGRVWFAGCIVSLALLASCAENERDNSSCGRVLPCGGDLVGTWKVEGACLDDVALSRSLTSILNESFSCTGATARGIRTEASGSIAFESDGTYERDMHFETSLSLVLPSSCTDAQSSTLTCEQLNEWFDALTKKPFDTFACTSAGSGCDCAVGLSAAFPTGGTYSTLETTVTLGTDRATAYDYCVQRDELHLMTLSTSGSGAPTVKSDIVLTK